MIAAAALASKLVLYAACLGAVGVATHRSIGLEPERRLGIAFCSLAIAATIVRLLVVNAEMGGGLGAAFSADNFRWTWRSFGLQSVAFVAGATLLTASIVAGSRLLSAIAAIFMAAGFGAAGHGAGLASPGITPAIVSLHALIAGYWIFAPLSLWPRANLNDAAIMLRTQIFSRFAVWLVPLIFVSGVWLLWRIGGGAETVVSSLYGRLLIGKLVLAAAILGLGAANLTLVTKKFETSPSAARRALRATLSADIVLFAAVLFMVAFATSFTGPAD